MALLLVMLLTLQCVTAGMTSLRPVGAASNDIVFITGTKVNIRSGAGTGNSQIGTVNCGERYAFISQKTASDGTVWYQVQYKPSQTGWIASSYTLKCGADASMQTVIDSVAKTYGTIGAQVAIIEKGNVTETFNYGYATKSSQKMATDTKLRVASLSKVFVAMNAMKMQEQGILDINTDIGTYWGAKLPKKVTLKNLLSHTSTLSDLSAKSTKSATLTQLKSSSSYYTSGTPGSSSVWMYNNYGVGVAGSTEEVAAKTTLDKYSHQNFLDPMGIDASFISGNVKNKNYATLYYSGGSAARTPAQMTAYTGSSEPGGNTTSFAGGLTICARDYARLLSILANDGSYGGKQYLAPSSVAAIESHLFNTSEHGGSFAQCMPLRYKANLYGQNEIYYHTGNAYGVLALASYNPNTRNGVVVVTSGAGAGRDEQGVYSVCSSISTFMYKYMERKAMKPATAISLDRSEITARKGEVYTLKAALTPADATETVTWSTSNPNCVSVSANGVVTVTGHGTSVITAKVGSLTASCTVTSAPVITSKVVGASVRVTEPYGLRFRVTIDNDSEFQNAYIMEYGMLVTGQGNLGGQELTIDTNPVRRIKCVNYYIQNGKITFNGVLTNIPQSSFDTELVARAYVIYSDDDGTLHTVYSDCLTRNFGWVAGETYKTYSAKVDPTESDIDMTQKLAALLGIELEEEQPEEGLVPAVETTPADDTQPEDGEPQDDEDGSEPQPEGEPQTTPEPSAQPDGDPANTQE